MIMKKIYNLSAIILLAVGLFSCNEKEFLALDNPGNLSSSSFPQSLSQLESEIGNSYGFRTGAVWGIPGGGMSTLGIEHFLYSTKGDGWDAFNQAAGLLWNLNEPNFWGVTMYSQGFEGVKRDNSIIEDCQRYYIKAQEKEKAYVKILEGEALIGRAIDVFYLQGFYGESIGDDADKKGMVMRRSVPKTREETYVARSSTKATYDSIIVDLKKGIELMGDYKFPSDQQGRFTALGAKALLGKVYVYLKRWPEAQTMLKSVIDDPTTALVSKAKFKKMWVDGKDDFNSETLLSLNSALAPTDNFGFDGGSNGLPRMFGTSYAIKNYDGTYGSTGFSWSMGFYPDENIKRFGYSQPLWTKEMDPVYIATAKVKRADSLSYDPRLFAYAYQPWVDSIQVDGTYYKVAYPFENNFKSGPSKIYHLFNLRKYMYTSFEPTKNPDTKGNSAVNIPIIRLADVYLLYAEALINGGGSSAVALDYINKVHRRAYGFPINASSPVDYSSLTSATRAPANDLVCYNNPLRYERWAELQGENSWWFDVKSWKLGQQETDYYHYVTNYGGVILTWEDRRYYYPIPTSDIETSNGLVLQNAGY